MTQLYPESKAGTFEKRVVLSLTTTYFEAPIVEDNKGRPALSFSDSEKVNGDPNRTYPLVISTKILG